MLETAEIVDGLETLEKELALRQGPFAESAYAWFVAKRDQEKAFAEEFLKAEGSVEARKAWATKATSDTGKLEEATFEARKRAITVLETRCSILQTLAKVGR
jgi:hypothetical protein